MKKSRNKYRLHSRGELMLVHECTDCNTLSINRIAADDDSESILDIFQNSPGHGVKNRERCRQQGIEMLDAEEIELVQRQLYGLGREMAAIG
jgi:hypothetical protein